MRLQKAVDQGLVFLFGLRKHGGFPSANLCNGGIISPKLYPNHHADGVLHAYVPRESSEVKISATHIQRRAHIPGTREAIAALGFRPPEIGLLLVPALRLSHGAPAPATHQDPPCSPKTPHPGGPPGWQSCRPRWRRATPRPRRRALRPLRRPRRCRRPRSRRSSAPRYPRGIGRCSTAPSLLQPRGKRAARVRLRRSRVGAKG